MQYELVAYCNLKLKVTKEKIINYKFIGTCVHWQCHYFEVSQIDHISPVKLLSVDGTLYFESVGNTGRVRFVKVPYYCGTKYCPFHSGANVLKTALYMALPVINRRS